MGVVCALLGALGGCSHDETDGNASGSTTGGGGGGTPAGCVPSGNASPIGGDCGVFVSSSLGDDGNDGSQAAPMKTLGRALELANFGKRRVYACAEQFDEAVEVLSGLSIFGGLDCTQGWTWVGDTLKTEVTAPEGMIPVTMRLDGGAVNVVHMEDVHVLARKPSANGASSIAAVTEGVELEFTRCVLEAGDGAAGDEGTPYAMSATGGAVGNPGAEACSGSQLFGGAEQLNDCGTPNDPSDDSIGGSGGTGQQNSGGNGSSGLPESAMNFGTGEGASVCTAGTVGDDGAEGAPGEGATGIGSITDTGFTGASGTDGSRGLPAQGGGGGGGSKGGTGAGKCTVAASAGGASGASGGSGGCGGLGGKGGGPGGASIALISLDARLNFVGVTLKTGRGGTGGMGGPGQIGGTGGDGGTGGTLPMGATSLHEGCNGGMGGVGGTGGPGGGGLGGHSIGIAYQGMIPTIESATTTIETGEAGTGGTGADPQHDGAAGVKADTQSMQ